MNDRVPPITTDPDPFLVVTYIPRNYLLSLVYAGRYSLGECIGKMAAGMEHQSTEFRKNVAANPPTMPSVVTIDQCCEWLRNCGRMLVFRAYAETTKLWKEYKREALKGVAPGETVHLDVNKSLACFRPIIQADLPDLGPLKPVKCALRASPQEKGMIFDVIPTGYAVYEAEFSGAWEDMSKVEIGERIDGNPPAPGPSSN